MAPTLPQALDALAKATHDSATSKVNLALAICTGATAAFTLLVAIFTYLTARKAAGSTQAAEEMVRIERERALANERPEVHLQKKTQPVHSEDRAAMIVVDIYSWGPGQVEGMQIFCACDIDGKLVPCRRSTDPPPLHLKRGRDKDEAHKKITDATTLFEVPREGMGKEVIVCHYADCFSSTEDRRVFHSVYDSREQGEPRRYFGHVTPFRPDYLQVCEACRRSGSPGRESGERRESSAI
jgi:hypothetical protein